MLRTIDHDIATGVYPDMTKHGWASDEWPQIWERVSAANILDDDGLASTMPAEGGPDTVPAPHTQEEFLRSPSPHVMKFAGAFTRREDDVKVVLARKGR